MVEVEVGQDGSISLPAGIREQMDLQPGAVVRVLVGQGLVMLTTRTDAVHAAAVEIEDALTDAGVTLDDMLESLRDDRERTYREHHSRTDA
ncbi:MAG: AbrB/MazE/SpoVT family DNA-binding domain-containing protein [Chloroflexi bacterium]|nr:AbrB/MazE/SpoVT family DNA-binding domain-containing protein [Chloroflexota bacterium]